MPEVRTKGQLDHRKNSMQDLHHHPQPGIFPHPVAIGDARRRSLPFRDLSCDHNRWKKCQARIVPDMDGMALCQGIKARPDIIKPISMNSTRRSSRARARSIRWGGDHPHLHGKKEDAKIISRSEGRPSKAIFIRGEVAAGSLLRVSPHRQRWGISSALADGSS